LIDDVRAIPGVENATAATNSPLLGWSWGHYVDVGAADGESRLATSALPFSRPWAFPGMATLIASRDPAAAQRAVIDALRAE